MACGCNRCVNYSVYSFVALTPLRESEKQPDPEQGLLKKPLADTDADKLKPVPLGSSEDKNGTNSTIGTSKDRARRRGS